MSGMGRLKNRSNRGLWGGLEKNYIDLKVIDGAISSKFKL